MDTSLSTPNKATSSQNKETRVPQMKEYNIIFAESQNSYENSHSQSNTNLSLPQLELTFWRENISMLDHQISQLKSFLSLKGKLLTKRTNPNDIEISNQKETYDLKIKELQDKYANEIKTLENEKNIIERIQTEIEDFNMRKYQLKRQKEKMQQLINKYQQQSYSKQNPYQFTRINDEDIDTQYNQIMTTSCNEMCRSRLGNKMLMSLDMGEINKNQNFANYKLAYPVLKKKKIVFNNNNNNNQNDKKTTLKHYNTNIIPSYQISNTSINNNNLNKINYNLHSMNKTNANNNNSNIPTGPTVPGNSRGLGKKKITLDNYNNYRNVDNFNFVTKTVY